MGEAPARSSLVPRDLTAEFVFDASRFARAFCLCRYALRRVCVCLFDFMPLASLVALSIVIRLAAFGAVVVG